MCVLVCIDRVNRLSNDRCQWCFYVDNEIVELERSMCGSVRESEKALVVGPDLYKLPYPHDLLNRHRRTDYPLK